MKDIKTIAILGAGIMGLISAYMLRRALPHAHITIFDPKGYPADNASFIAGGMLAPYSELDHTPHTYLPAGLHSIELWKTCEKECGISFGFSQNGSLLLAHKNDRHLLERFKTILPKGDPSIHMIEDINTLEPQLCTQTLTGGIALTQEAHLNPRLTMTALSDLIKDKKHTALNTETAATQFDIVIECTGMDARPSSPQLRGVKGEVALVKNTEFTLTRPLRLMHPRYPLYIVPRPDHVFLIGATIIESNESNSVSIRSGMELFSALYSLHPSFANAQILEIKAGVRPSFPDNLPRISRDRNIIRANGLYRHGFLFSPVMAQCICSLLTQEHNAYTNLFLKAAEV